MLIFLSDLHLCDGTSGETIQPDAFKKFVGYAGEMVRDAKAKELEIVLLGDILDVIRSSEWLKDEARPWTDDKPEAVQKRVQSIVNKICKNNQTSFEYIRSIKKLLPKVKVKITYIPGNHDWLINRYPEIRKQVAEHLGLEEAEENTTSVGCFPTEKLWKDHHVFARHGDVYDPFNFEGNRNASSLGDAIVIDLLNKFPTELEKELAKKSNPALVERLKEIDNVRPLMEVPAWIQGACQTIANQKEADTVKQVWNRMVDEFLSIPFVRQHDKRWWPDAVDALQLLLKISKFVPLKTIARLRLTKVQPEEDEYGKHAYDETVLRRNKADYVVYGHTHRHRMDPLDIAGGVQKMYFNTGTWRKVHVRATQERQNIEFGSWYVMTYIAFYRKEERKTHNYEVWNGALS